MADWRDGLSPEFESFWAERRICLLTTLRPNGTPHVVPVGATIDVVSGIARVIARRHSRKVVHVRTAGPGGARVAVGQVDGGRWCTVEGLAVVREDPVSVAAAERLYARRYRVPKPNPERVVIEITVDRLLGSVR
jgi:hypothetical protein